MLFYDVEDNMLTVFITQFESNEDSSAHLQFYTVYYNALNLLTLIHRLIMVAVRLII